MRWHNSAQDPMRLIADAAGYGHLIEGGGAMSVFAVMGISGELLLNAIYDQTRHIGVVAGGKLYPA